MFFKLNACSTAVVRETSTLVCHPDCSQLYCGAPLLHSPRTSFMDNLPVKGGPYSCASFQIPLFLPYGGETIVSRVGAKSVFSWRDSGSSDKVASFPWGWVGVSSVQSLSRFWLFATPWIAACQASLSITISRRSPRLTSIESVMPSSHLILGHPLLLLPPIPPSIRVFSNESTLCMRYPKYWSFSFSIIPSKEIPGLISFRMDWLDLL